MTKGTWDALGRPAVRPASDPTPEDCLFARVFGSADGLRLLAMLREETVERSGASLDDRALCVLEGRRQVDVIFHFLKQHVPGFEAAYIVGSAPFVGIRETRRILGEYVLDGDDIRAGRRFDDAIGHGAYPMDIHHAEGTGVTFHPVGGDGDYDIPYRCLVPRRPDNLLVAGRCISCSHEAHGSLRVMIPAMVTGQAAGVAAALSSRSIRPPRELGIGQVQEELRRQGADLDR